MIVRLLAVVVRLPRLIRLICGLRCVSVDVWCVTGSMLGCVAGPEAE